MVPRSCRRAVLLLLPLALILLAPAPSVHADEKADVARMKRGVEELEKQILDLVKHARGRIEYQLECTLTGTRPSQDLLPVYVEGKYWIHPSVVRNADILGLPSLLALLQLKIPSDQAVQKTLVELRNRSLRSQDMDIRGRALSATIELPRNQKAMTDWVHAEIVRAVRALGKKGVVARKVLWDVWDRECADDGWKRPSHVWYQLAWWIGEQQEFGEEILPEFRRMLRATGEEGVDIHVAWALIIALQRMGIGPLVQAAPDIFHAYKHGPFKVQKEAAEAFLMMRGAAAKPLRRAMAIKKNKEKKAAKVAGAHLTGEILTWLEENEEDKADWVPAVLGALLPASFDRVHDWVANKEKPEDDRIRLLPSLAEHKSTRKKAVSAWIKLLRDKEASPELMIAILDAMGAQGKYARSGKGTVTKMTKHEHPDVASAATAALAKIAPPKKDD